jgi:osmotically-inducible protein OsmY
MPNRKAPSYDDIVRRTVPDPDSSWRPSSDQEREAQHGFRAVDAGENALLERVRETIRAGGFDADAIGVEVDADRVILRGTVRDALALRKIPELVRQLDGVEDVIDHLVIGARAP